MRDDNIAIAHKTHLRCFMLIFSSLTTAPLFRFHSDI